MLKDREKSILSAVIEGYIRTARPVASRDLARHFDLSPATLRSELMRLDDMGYIEQPHTSAGRVPTDRGYRFFVDYLIPSNELAPNEQALLSQVFRVQEQEAFMRELGRAVSQISGMFTGAGLAEDGVRYETGFSEILDEPEFEDIMRIRAFGRLVEDMGSEMKRLLSSQTKDEDEGRIFIGRENPWKQARDYAMAVSYWEHPAGCRGFVTMIGPKRTNYRKHKAIIKYMETLI